MGNKQAAAAASAKRPKIVAIDADGKATRLKAERLEIDFGDGRKLLLAFPERAWGDLEIEADADDEAAVPMLSLQPGACNLLTLLSLMAQQAIQIDEVEDSVLRIGMRYCTSKALTELLAKAAAAHPPYADRLAETLTAVLHMIEKAMRQSLAGNPRAAVLELRDDALRTQNAKVIESAWGVLKRYETRIEDAPALGTDIQALRVRYASFATRPVIGDKNLRQSGGVSLRMMDIADSEPPPTP